MSLNRPPNSVISTKALNVPVRDLSAAGTPNSPGPVLHTGKNTLRSESAQVDVSF